ncbi:hypothetical protein [Cellulosimicrobium sp. NPDC057862]|uniref:hypothetical protein n=1 Tax=Cellulosimicrobium sp. NPDC057862 TaxID=3346266 RepID=UPI00366A5795
MGRRTAAPDRRRSVVATALLWCLVAVLLVVPSAPSAIAAPTVPFAAKFATNANGAVVTVGNNLLTCAPSASCTRARAGAAADNNGFTMVALDADADASTGSSSMSRLDLPTGSTVLWAGLYWGARLQAGAGGQGGSAAQINQMRLRVPGAASYQTVAASTAARDLFGPNPASYNAYQRFADVTTLVQRSGGGEYWGADVEAATGQDRYAGWALTVVYSAPGLPLRNLTVFDGFNAVGSGSPQDVTVSGFLAPEAGTVDAQLTMVAYEGDLAQTGDYTRLGSTQLATALSPGSNFFDSANGSNGQSVQTRSPADRNMLGFDIKNLGASGAIPNGATSARFTFSSNGDVYYPGVLGMAINLYAPEFTASSKTVTNLAGNDPARPGDTLQYTLNYANTGQDPAIDVVSEDVLPPGTTFVPGSLALVPFPGATPVPLTAGPGDDVGEVDGRTVRVRLGAGASATGGGTMACSGAGCTDDGTSRAAYTFQVTLDDAAGGTTVTNLAELGYRTATTGIAATYTTNPAVTEVTTRADVAVTKDVSPDPASAGGEVVSTVMVTNAGPNPALSTELRDPAPPGTTVESVDAPPGVSCTQEVVCSVGRLDPGASVVVVVHGRTPPDSAQPSVTNVAIVSTTSFDPDLTDNTAADTAPLLRAADLAVVKSAAPASAPPGSTVTSTLSVTNQGPSDAQDVVLTDAVDDPGQLALTDVTATTGGAECAPVQAGGVRCTVTALPAGATATVTVTGVLAATLEGGVVVGNSATVTAGTADPDASDNSATARVTTSDPQADVRLSKSGPPGVVAGSTITYAVVANNWGPSVARGTVVTDVVPAGVTVTSAVTDRGTCTVQPDAPAPGRQTVSCELGDLPAASGGGTQPGATATVTVTGTVDPAFTGTALTNGATVRTTTTDPEPGNDTATATTPVSRSLDLSVSKRANRTSLPGAAPRPVDYTITVRNAGPSAARDVTVTDLVPLALRFDAVTTDAGTCDTSQVATAQPGDPDHGLLTCTLPGPIPVGGTATVTVSTTAEEILEGGPDVTETVTVSAPSESPTTNNTATWVLTGEPYIDLGITKSAPATVTAGASGLYTLAVTNHPPDPEEEQLVAPAPTVRDTLPEGVGFLGASIAGSSEAPDCTTAGDVVTCVLPDDLAPDETVVLEMSVSFDPGLAAGTRLVNSAEVVSQETSPDPVLSNNTATAASTVTTTADVLVTDAAITPTDPGSTGPGSRRTVTFTLRNDGPSAARDVVFRQAIDLDAAVVEGSLPSGCSLDNGELVCAVGDLAPGQSVPVTFDAVVAGYEEPGTYEGRTRVFTSTPETDQDNNLASATTDVTQQRTDLRIAKTAVGTSPNPADGHPSFVAGRPFTYQLTVSLPDEAGGGVADATGVLLTDPMPAGFVATAASTTKGTCTVSPGRVTCRLGTLAAWPAASAPVVVTVSGFVDVSAEGEQVPNVATATSATPNLEGDPTSVQAAAPVDVVEQADLRLLKSADAASVDPDGVPVFPVGGSVGFTLTTVNAGPSDVEQAVVDDTLPAGLLLDPAASPGCAVTGTDDQGRQQVRCTVGAVAVGGSVATRLVATTVSTDVAREVENTATASSGATDPEPADNTATALVRLVRLADVAITSAVSTTTPAAGGRLTYTGFTLNNGPSSAWDVTGLTTFPPGLVPVSWEVPFNTCTWNRPPPADPETTPWEDFSYVLSCAATDPSAPFEPGVATTSVVVMQIPGDAPAGDYPARSVVETPTPETRLDNNATAQTVTVQHVSDTRVVKTLVEPNPMQSGRPATWRLTVTNDGPSVAENVVVSDNVPAGMSYVSAVREAGGECPAPERYSTADGDTEEIVRCPLETLDVGESASVLVTFGVDPGTSGQELCNAALVGSGSLDPAAADNEDQACGTVTAPPATDVSVTLSPPSGQARPGERVELDAVVRNGGPAATTGTVLTLEVPAGLTDVDAVLVVGFDGSTAELRCTPGGVTTLAVAVAVATVLTCVVGDLPPGAAVTYRLTGTATGSPGTDLVVTARVAHGSPDTVPENDVASAAVRLLLGPTTEPPPGPGVPPVSPGLSPGPLPPADPSSAEPPHGLAATGATTAGLAALAVLLLGLGALAARGRRRLRVVGARPGDVDRGTGGTRVRAAARR